MDENEPVALGGRLIDSPRIYDAYADYFVKFVHAYKREGVPSTR